MPRLVLIGDRDVVPLNEEPFLQENRLQDLLEEHPELIALDEVDPSASTLVPIGREVSLGGQALDLLFLDASGRLTAVEAKLRKNSEIRRQVIGQTLEYVSYLSSWTVEEVERQAEDYFKKAKARGMSGMSLERLAGTVEGDVDAEELKLRIGDRLRSQDIRAVIAVDRIVDPLRNIVTFINSTSRFALFLLEVQEHRAPDGTRLAIINVYGGPGRQAEGQTRALWDESRFLARLIAQSNSNSAGIVEHLYGFIQEEADSAVWGTGAEQGSVGFGVRRANVRLTIFGVNTKGQVYISTGALNRYATGDALDSYWHLMRDLKLSPDGAQLEGDLWVTFDAARLDDETLDKFKRAVLAIRDAIAA